MCGTQINDDDDADDDDYYYYYYYHHQNILEADSENKVCKVLGPVWDVSHFKAKKTFSNYSLL